MTGYAGRGTFSSGLPSTSTGVDSTAKITKLRGVHQKRGVGGSDLAFLPGNAGTQVSIEELRFVVHILITSLPLPSHLRMFVPLARALVAAGHRISAALHVQGHQYLTPHGIEVFGVGVDLADFTGRSRVSCGDSGRATGQCALTAEIFTGPLAEHNADAYMSLVEELKPDLILRGDTEFGGYLVAEKLGIPHVCLETAGAANTVRPDFLHPRMDAHRARLRLEPDPNGLSLYRFGFIDHIPAELTFQKYPIATSKAYRFPMPEHPGEALPDWFADLPTDRPLVLAALGTLIWELAPQLLRNTVAALSDVDCAAIVLTGGHAVPEAARAHIKVVDYLPQPLALPACDLFISHGGMNSIREALQSSVPMVVAPFAADQPHNAERIDALGLGVRIDPDAATDQIRAACQRVLDTPDFRYRTEKARRHFLTMPDVERAADDLVRSFAP